MYVNWHINSSEVEQSVVNEFLINHPEHSFFQSQSFNKFYEENNFKTIKLVGTFNNKVVAYCNVLLLEENYGILSGLTSRAIIWGGPLVENDIFFEQTLLKVKNVLRNKVIYLQIRNLFPLSNTRKQLLSLQGILYNEHFTILNRLNNQLMTNYQSQARNKIRKAIKNDLVFKHLTKQPEIETAGNLIIHTYKEIKLPCPNITFFRETSNVKEIKVFGAFKDLKMVSARFCLTWGDYLYDWYAGYDKTTYDLCPNDFIVHKVFEWGFENGFKTFDFGGAGNSKSAYGVRDFKLKFGGELIEFGRNEIIFQPFKYKLGKLGFQILKKFRK